MITWWRNFRFLSRIAKTTRESSIEFGKRSATYRSLTAIIYSVAIAEEADFFKDPNKFHITELSATYVNLEQSRDQTADDAKSAINGFQRFGDALPDVIALNFLASIEASKLLLTTLAPAIVPSVMHYTLDAWRLISEARPFFAHSLVQLIRAEALTESGTGVDGSFFRSKAPSDILIAVFDAVPTYARHLFDSSWWMLTQRDIEIMNDLHKVVTGVEAPVSGS